MKIAFMGPICSGKSTLSNQLKNNNNFKVFSFAEPVKKYCTKIFNMKFKDRKLLQQFADKCKEINPLVWVNILEKKIIENPKCNIIIDDLRYPNELKMLEKYNFIIIKLNIKKPLQIKRIIETYPSTYDCHIKRLKHDSESYYDNLNYTEKIDITENKNIPSLIKELYLIIYK